MRPHCQKNFGEREAGEEVDRWGPELQEAETYHREKTQRRCKEQGREEKEKAPIWSVPSFWCKEAMPSWGPVGSDILNPRFSWCGVATRCPSFGGILGDLVCGNPAYPATDPAGTAISEAPRALAAREDSTWDLEP